MRKKCQTPSNDVINDDVHDYHKVPKDPKQTSLKPFTLPSSFPQRMTMAKLDLQFEKFLEVSEPLH